MEHFQEGITPLKHWCNIYPYEKSNKHKSLLLLIYQNLNGALPSRKCSIKAPDKCESSIYVLTNICL